MISGIGSVSTRPDIWAHIPCTSLPSLDITEPALWCEHPKLADTILHISLCRLFCELRRMTHLLKERAPFKLRFAHLNNLAVLYNNPRFPEKLHYMHEVTS